MLSTEAVASFSCIHFRKNSKQIHKNLLKPNIVGFIGKSNVYTNSITYILISQIKWLPPRKTPFEYIHPFGLLK